MIRLIVGLMKKNNGRIMINGYSQDEDFRHAMSSVGAIIENPEFYSYLTGFENLELYAAMHNGVTEERMHEVVKRVRLEHAIHQKVKTYSLGMKQRLGIAQAILHQPNLLILDEPTNGLDPAGMKEFREHLQTLVREEGTSVLFATHLLHEVEELCDRMIIIQKGEIKASTMLRDIEGKEQMLMNIQPVEKAVTWLETFESTFKKKTNISEHQRGFKALRVLRPKKDEEVYLIMTLWESEDLFEDFQESEAFFQPNDDTGSIFSRPAYLTSYHAVTDN
ncbi:ATP-binding cassette domain-containing protein [Bacillus subtilis]|nr:ATP-binding cassette domain-containing protein [Bacillus subtilis]